LTERVEIAPGDVKQVIVIRRDLNMRRGKEIAQGSHASSAWLAEIVGAQLAGTEAPPIDEAAVVWLTTSHRKITLQIRGEDEPVALHEKACALGIRSHLITDSGRTEFDGVPTRTALALGPALSSLIDQVTGDLPIY
jgi:peptidyl-tRNA hydrolase, PTH2 family